MIRLAARAFSLAAAVAMTFGATAALTTYGVWRLPPYRCHLTPPPTLYTFGFPNIAKPPPPLPKFLRPRVVRVKPPEILCEVPGDPAAVTQCRVRRETE